MAEPITAEDRALARGSLAHWLCLKTECVDSKRCSCVERVAQLVADTRAREYARGYGDGKRNGVGEVAQTFAPLRAWIAEADKVVATNR